MNTPRTTFLMALLTMLPVLIGGVLGGKGGMTMAFLLAGGGMMSLLSTHPPIPERVHRLEYLSRTHDY